MTLLDKIIAVARDEEKSSRNMSQNALDASDAAFTVICEDVLCLADNPDGTLSLERLAGVRMALRLAGKVAEATTGHTSEEIEKAMQQLEMAE